MAIKRRRAPVEAHPPPPPPRRQTQQHRESWSRLDAGATNTATRTATEGRDSQDTEVDDVDQLPLSKRARLNLDTVMAKVPPKMLETGPAPDDGDQIDLSLAENWLIRKEVMREYRKAFSEKFESSHLSWPEGFWGDHQLLRTLAELFNARFKPHRPVRYEHITTAPGAAGCLDALVYNICDPGDGVLVPTPFWNGYNVFFAARCAVTPLPVTVESVEASLTSAGLIPALERAIATASCPIKALILTNPHNPLGRCYAKDVLEDCIRLCNRHRIHLVSDEVFALSTFQNDELPRTPFTSVLSLDARALGCNPALVHAIWSTSKDLGSSGIKMGCIVTQANKPLRDAISVAVPMKLPTVTSLLVNEVLRSPAFPKIIDANSDRLKKAYDTLVAFLKKKGIAFIPCDAGTFVLAQIAPWAETWDDEAWVISRLSDKGVVVSSGRQYRMHEPGWARICFAADKKVLKEAIRRMDKADVLHSHRPKMLVEER